MKITKNSLQNNLFVALLALVSASSTYGMNDNNNDDNNKKNENKRPRETEIKESEHDNVHKKKKQNASEKELLSTLCNKDNVSEEELEQYIKTMQDVETTTKDGNTILMLACSMGSTKLMRSLVEQKKANVRAQCNKGSTPFIYAIFNSGSLEILDILLEHDQELLTTKNYEEMTPLLAAVDANKLKMVQYIIEKLGKDAQKNINTCDHVGAYPLSVAIYKYMNTKQEQGQEQELQSYLNIIELLILNGADTNINYRGQEDYRLIVKVCDVNNASLLKLLLKKPQTDINAFEPDRKLTPLMLAASRGYHDIVDILLDQPNIDINQTCMQGAHALLYCTSKLNSSMALKLIKRGACVNLQTKSGVNALMQLFISLQRLRVQPQSDLQQLTSEMHKIINAILDAGIDLSTKIIHNGVNSTAIDIASRVGFPVVSTELLNISQEQGDFTQGKILQMRQPATFYLQNLYNTYKNNLKYEENSGEYKQHSNYIKMLYYFNRLFYSNNYNINEILSTCKFRTNDDKKTYYNLPLTKEELKMGSQLLTFFKTDDYNDLSFNYLCLADRWFL